MQYLCVCVWTSLFHLGQCLQNLIYVVTYCKISFFSKTNLLLYVFVSFFKLSIMDIRVIFYSLVIVKTNVMNMSVPIPLWDSDFSSFGKIPKSEMARSYSIFNLLLTFHAVFTSKHNNFAFPPIVYKGFDFSISSVTLVIFC